MTPYPPVCGRNFRLLAQRRVHHLGYRADLLEDIATGPLSDSLVVVVGPRRVGKSVVLIDTAAQLCARPDLDPRQVIHVPCDGMRDRDLRRVLTLARDQTRSVDRDEPRRRIWLFDEISGVKGWTGVIKPVRDSTAFGEDTVVVTGRRWVNTKTSWPSCSRGELARVTRGVLARCCR